MKEKLIKAAHLRNSSNEFTDIAKEYGGKLYFQFPISRITGGLPSANHNHRYAKVLRNNGWVFPPVVLIVEGVKAVILDGHNRLAAARGVRMSSVPAWVIPQSGWEKLAMD